MSGAFGVQVSVAGPPPRVALTPEGATYLAHCRQALQALQAGQDLISAAQRVPQGVLRVSLPPILGPTLVARLHQLTASHPRLCLDLRLSDRKVKLLEEEVDVAIRIGALPDSGLVARRLRTPRWVTVAAPAYLARRGTPRAPADLARHSLLKFVNPTGHLTEWTFAATAGGDGRVHADMPTHHRFDEGQALVTAALSGLGVVQAFDFLVTGHLEAGRLLEVLPNHACPALPMHALCRPGRQKAPKVRVFLDFLVDLLGR